MCNMITTPVAHFKVDRCRDKMMYHGLYVLKLWMSHRE